MSSGRPPEGLNRVDRLEGPEEVKERLRVILETLSGTCSIREASEKLGVSESRVHELRWEAMEGAVGALMPKPAGRPPAKPDPEESAAELKARIRELEVDLQAAMVRTEMALAMPHLFEKRAKKKSSRRQRNRRKG